MSKSTIPEGNAEAERCSLSSSKAITNVIIHIPVTACWGLEAEAISNSTAGEIWRAILKEDFNVETISG
jgi:hypothetical protein